VSASSARIATLRERARALLELVDEIERVRKKRERRLGADWPQEFEDRRHLIVSMATDVLKPQFESEIKFAADRSAALADWENWISMRVADAIELAGELRRLR
jgi:hypothetical protein